MGEHDLNQVDRYMVEGRYCWWPPKNAININSIQSKPPNYPYSGEYRRFTKSKARLVENIFKQALDVANLGKHKKAIKYYKKIIKINYYIPEAWNNIGLSYYARKKLEAAITSFEVASRLYKESNIANIKNSDLLIQIKKCRIGTLVNMGIIYRELKDYHMVISTYERVLLLNPDKIDVRYELGTIHENLGNHEKAIECFEKLVEKLYGSEKHLDLKSKAILKQLKKKGINVEKIKNKALDEWY